MSMNSKWNTFSPLPPFSVSFLWQFSSFHPFPSFSVILRQIFGAPKELYRLGSKPVLCHTTPYILLVVSTKICRQKCLCWWGKCLMFIMLSGESPVMSDQVLQFDNFYVVRENQFNTELKLICKPENFWHTCDWTTRIRTLEAHCAPLKIAFAWSGVTRIAKRQSIKLDLKIRSNLSSKIPGEIMNKKVRLG